MSPYFSGGVDPRALMQEDYIELQRSFLYWQVKVDHWAAMDYPQEDGFGLLNQPADVMAERTSYTAVSDQDRARRRVSQFRTDFVHTGNQSLISRMDRSDWQIELGISGDAVEQERRSRLERFLFGLLNQLNEQVVRAGRGTSWQYLVSTFCAMPAKIVAMPYIVRGKTEGTGEVRCDLLDPRNVYHDFSDMPRRFVYDEWKSWRTVMDLLTNRLPEETADELFPRTAPAFLQAHDTRAPIRVTDYWLEERDNKERSKLIVYQGLMLNGEPVYLRKTAFLHMPAVIVSINSRGALYQTALSAPVGAVGLSPYAAAFIARHAEPWFAPIEKSISMYNELRSLEALGIDKVINPPITGSALDGTLKLDVSTWGASTYIPLNPGDVLQVLQVQGAEAAQVGHLADGLKQELEWAFPGITRGESSFSGESGYHFDRRDQTVNILTPYGRGGSALVEGVLSEFVHQIRQEPDLTFSLSSKAVSGKEMGHFMTETFSVKDLPESFVIRVNTALALPKDEYKEAQIFAMLTNQGPLSAMSVLSARANMGIPDPKAEQDLIDQQQMANSQQAQQLALLRRMRQEMNGTEEAYLKAKRDGAALPVQQALLNEFHIAEEQYKVLEQQLLGSGQGFQQTPGLQGDRPQDLPPETKGGLNPDQAAARAGGVSSYLGGRGPAVKPRSPSGNGRKRA